MEAFLLERRAHSWKCEGDGERGTSVNSTQEAGQEFRLWKMLWILYSTLGMDIRLLVVLVSILHAFVCIHNNTGLQRGDWKSNTYQETHTRLFAMTLTCCFTSSEFSWDFTKEPGRKSPPEVWSEWCRNLHMPPFQKISTFQDASAYGKMAIDYS